MPSPQPRIAINKSPIMISKCKSPIEVLENMKSMPLTTKTKKLVQLCVSLIPAKYYINVNRNQQTHLQMNMQQEQQAFKAHCPFA